MKGRVILFSRILWLISIVLIAGGCSSEKSITSPVLVPAPARTVVGEPVTDVAMGHLSGLARHISAGLQDPSARGALVRLMKSDAARGIGIDLQACESGTVRGLLEAGSRRGADPYDVVCRGLKGAAGVMLYMDRDRLAGWDSTVIPVVTAIEHPGKPIPAKFLGYRSPTRTIELSHPASLAGPILVVLPLLHPTRWSRQAAFKPTIRTVVVPVAPQDAPIVPPGSRH